MSHKDQQAFINFVANRFNLLGSEIVVVEIGSQDVNGRASDSFLLTNRSVWIGLDIGPGKNVDFVIPGELIQLPDSWADMAISTECFEHTPKWREILINMIRITRPGGMIVLTFAGPGRRAHGTIDTKSIPSPYTTDYYRNVSLMELTHCINLDKHFSHYSIEVNTAHSDTYFWGIRNDLLSESEWMPTEEALARARGQLGKVIFENAILKKENARLRSKSLTLMLMKLTRKLGMNMK